MDEKNFMLNTDEVKLNLMLKNIKFNRNIWSLKRTIGWVINGTGLTIDETPFYLAALLIELSDELYTSDLYWNLRSMDDSIKNETCNILTNYFCDKIEQNNKQSLKEEELKQIAWILGMCQYKEAQEIIEKAMLQETIPGLKFEYTRALARIENTTEGKGFTELLQMSELEEYQKHKDKIELLKFEIKEGIKTVISSHHSQFTIIGYTVFISYAHEKGEDMGDWVISFGKRLHENGIFTFIDKWYVLPASNFDAFMDRIKMADFTLMIWTCKYIKKMTDEDTGVYKEILRIKDLPKMENRIIPILKDADCDDIIPEEFKPIYRLNFSSIEKIERDFPILLNHIQGKKKIPPLKPEPDSNDE